MTRVEFGKRLNRVRKKTGIKTELLAEKIDVSVGFLNGVFSGRVYPSVETFVKLVNTLGCSANELLRGEPWPVDETAVDSRLLPIGELPPDRARHVCNVLDAILTDLEQAKESAPSER
ncbi:helix-turn-helix domain-containing protein [Bittarella massiliensis (ex Durand et al. 2017)]|uniref:helix-turn-helix domain-containing protein n=1 Tax=Bittarella massiliensis (ex Durand et al. 2017) TaxID=1720313 RepID=UPI001AA0DD1C|nr:helix-turn-helix transcriptional regulator [Bittarella massiliensis (ex Durand et al. 2017)]MBO1679583.1 helix-turn-helix transcriptional regulator [Bittarella massiliensis (ex Durand et al. 2017)]